MKRFHKTTGASLAVMILILSSCSGQPPASPQPQETSTRTPAPTSSPRPTYIHPTMQPANATRIAKISQERAVKTAVVQNALDDCNGYPDYDWGTVEREFSPSGNWYVAYCAYPDTGVNYTKVIGRTNSVVWEVPYRKSEGLNPPEGGQGGQMLIKAWSYDEKYAYFVRYYCCQDGPGLMFVNGNGLYRLDLITGEILEIEKYPTAFSFSEDGKYLARFDRETNKVIVENLETHKYSSYEMYEALNIAGMFSWSPDGSKIVFIATDKDWVDTGTGFALFLIDVNNHSLKLLIHQPQNYFFVQNWISDTQVILEFHPTDWFNWSDVEYYTLNILTHELTPSDENGIPLTPTP